MSAAYDVYGLSLPPAPGHSTIAAFVSSMHTEMVSLFCDILLGGEEQQLLGGTVFALDGLKLSSNASKEWSGAVADLTRKQAKLEAKIRQLVGKHQQVDALNRWNEPVSVPSSTEAIDPEKPPHRKDATCSQHKPRRSTHKISQGNPQKSAIRTPASKKGTDQKYTKRLTRLRRQVAGLKK